MGTTSTSDLELIIDRVKDPRVKAKAALKLLPFSEETQESLRKHAEEYLQMLMQGGEDVASEFPQDHSAEDPGIAVLDLLPDDRARQLAEVYLAARLTHFRQQRPSMPVNFDSMRKLVEKYGISRETYELCELAQEVISPQIFSKKAVPRGRDDQVMEEVFNIVKNSSRNRTLDRTCSVFRDSRFKSRYCNDDEARRIACEVVEIELGGPNRTDFWDVQSIISDYAVQDVEPVVRRAATAHLLEGRLSQAKVVMNEFGYALTEDMIEEARRTLIERILYSVEHDDIEAALKNRGSLNVLRDHTDPTTRECTLPQAVIPEGYDGKIVLVEYRGKQYLRCHHGEQIVAYHPTIVESFKTELEQNGHAPEVNQDDARGAYLQFTEGGTIRIYGTSTSLGECDKEMAKKLVESIYPTKKVTIEPAENPKP